MLFSDRKVKTKVKKAAKKPIVEKTVGKTELSGSGLMVNPGNEQHLARCESRLHRVNLWLVQKKDRFKRGSNEELAKQTVKRRLEMQIKLLKGDF
jgi:hypothetical protein